MSNSNSSPLIPLSEHIAMVQKLAPWLDAASAEELVRQYDSYTAFYETPDGSKWAPADVSYHVRDKIENEYAARLYGVLKTAKQAVNLDGNVLLTDGAVDLLLGFVTLHAPELLRERSTDTDNNE